MADDDFTQALEDLDYKPVLVEDLPVQPNIWSYCANDTDALQVAVSSDKDERLSEEHVKCEESGYDSLLQQVENDLDCSDSDSDMKEEPNLDSHSIKEEICDDHLFSAKKESNLSDDELENSETKPDDYLFCDICNEWELDSCLEHPPNFVEDSSSNTLGLPDILVLRNNSTGVLSRANITCGSLFGPFKTTSVVDYPALSIQTRPYLWEVKQYDGQSLYLLASTPTTGDCNWLQFVRFVEFGENQTQNLIALQFKGLVYYKTFRPIGAGEELIVSRGNGLPWTKENSLDNLKLGNLAKNSKKSAKQYKCDECPAVYGNWKVLRAHRNGSRHRPKDDIRCRICPFVAKSRLSLIRHVQGHRASGKKMGTKTFVCSECSKTFSYRHHFERHKSTHIKKSESSSSIPDSMKHKYRCPLCNFGVDSAQQLEWHVEWHNESEINKQQSTSAIKEEETDRLLSGSESGTESHSGQSLSSADLSGHATANGYKCPFCENVYTKSSARSRHEWKHHRQLKEQSDLQKSLAKMDPKVFPCMCDMCPKSFKNKYDLRYHKMRHNGQYAFICAICKGGYITKGELRKHTKRSHPGNDVI